MAHVWHYLSKSAVLWLLGVSLLACAPAPLRVDVVPFGDLPASPAERPLDVYSGEAGIANLRRPYREIAALTITARNRRESEADVIAEIVAAARELGADGLILSEPVERVDLRVFPSVRFYDDGCCDYFGRRYRSSRLRFVPLYLRDERLTVRGTAIVYTD